MKIPPAGNHVPGQVIIKLKSDIKIPKERSPKSLGISSLDSLNKSKGVEAVTPLFTRESASLKSRSEYSDAFDTHGLQNVFLVSVDPSLDIDQLCQEYAQLPEVEYAEPDFYVRAAAIPNDPSFSQQWGLNNTGQTGGTPDKDIDGPEAWDVHQGSASVVIAILDTGVDLDHPDLNAKIVVVPGSDLVNIDSDPNDDNGHGTHIAGIAAAETNNGLGGAGVDWNAKIMPIKVLNAAGIGSISVLAQGINLAVTNGAEVINISLGTYSISGTLETAVAAASSSCLIVAAAGNDGLSTPYFPAAYTQVLGVGAHDHNGNSWVGSNHGDWVDAYAPGVNIFSTYLNDSYTSLTGTSNSAAFASGIGSLLLAQNPGWSPNMARAQILQTLQGSQTNAHTALSTPPVVDLRAVSLRISDTSGDGDGVADAGETVDLYVTLKNEWLNATNVTGVLSTSDSFVTVTDANGAWGNIGSLQELENIGDKFSFTVSPSTPGKHIVPFQLSLTANGGAYADTLSLTTQTQRGFNFSGVIAADTEWATGTTVIVTGNILVSSGATLTIRPGVDVRFDGNYYLGAGNHIGTNGRIVAQGVPGQMILFTSNQTNPAPGDWGTVEAWGADCIFQHCLFEYGGGSGSHPEFWVCTLGNTGSFNDCVLRFCNNGLKLSDFLMQSAEVLVTDNLIEYTRGGLYSNLDDVTCRRNIIRNSISGGPPVFIISPITFEHNSIYNNTGNGIEISGSDLSHCTIIGNSENGIYLYGGPDGRVYTRCNLGPHSPYQVNHTDNGDVFAYNNYWGLGTTVEMITKGPGANISAINDFYDNFGFGEIDYANWLSTPETDAPPFLWKVETTPTSPFGLELVDLTLTFSKTMNSMLTPTVYFQLDGEPMATVYDLTNNLVWDGGSSTLSAGFEFDETIPNGTYRLFIGSGEDMDGMPSPDDSSSTFEVDITGAAGSLVLGGDFSGGCIQLSWNPSSSPNLLGYNVYRSETSGGGYEKINFAPVTEPQYTDCSISTEQKGLINYYYVYTVVNSFGDESPFSQEITILGGEGPSGFSGLEWTLYE